MSESASLGITHEQGLFVRYRIGLCGSSFADIATTLGCSRASVRNVVSGKAHSKKIEAAVARRLGYASWNEMVEQLRKEALT